MIVLSEDGEEEEGSAFGLCICLDCLCLCVFVLAFLCISLCIEIVLSEDGRKEVKTVQI